MIRTSIPNLQNVVRQIRERKTQIAQKNEQLIDKIVAVGNDKLADNLDSAQYDGNASRYVMPPEFNQSNNSVSIGIGGEAVTFIEFGTGTYYADDHPMMDEFGYERGTFGKGLGAKPPWYFREPSGSVGKNFIGEVDAVTRSGAVIIKTYGNPANRVVYNTAKELREEIPNIAREVYKK